MHGGEGLLPSTKAHAGDSGEGEGGRTRLVVVVLVQHARRKEKRGES